MLVISEYIQHTIYGNVNGGKMLNIDRLKYFKDLFIGWNEKEINIAYQMILFLKKVKVDLEEFEEYANHVQKNRFYNEKAKRNFAILEMIWQEENPEKCPECGSPMFIADVNDKKCTMVGGKWKSVWTCKNIKECGHQIWKKKPTIFEIKKRMKPFYDKWGAAPLEELISDKIDKLVRKRLQSYKSENNCGGCKEK